MSISRRVVLGCAAVLLIVLASQPLTAGTGPAPAPYGSDQKFANGLWMLTFEAPAGQIRVNLPERLRQGELVSGTVELFPRGEGRELVDNLAALKAHTLRIDGEELSAGSRSLRWRLAAGEANGRIELLDSTGLAVAAAPTTLTPAGEKPAPRARPFELPHIVQRGHTFAVRGPFDGDFANTRVLIAGRPVEKVAESSEELIVRNNAEDLGRVRAVVAEGALRQRSAFNSFDIDLSAPAGPGKPGTAMPVRVRIEGLQGVRQPFALALYNYHPEVAKFEGASEPLYRVVNAGEVDARGTFDLNLQAAVKSFGEVEMQAFLNATAVAEHVPNVSWPPHTANITYPTTHTLNVTWPPHTANVSFPNYHALNVSWPAHVPNGTFPTYHAQNVTWPPHTANVTFPNYHALNITWPPHVPNGTFANVHATNVTWPPHVANVTFPTFHITGTSWPPHQTGISFLAVGHPADPTTDDDPDTLPGDTGATGDVGSDAP